MDIGFIGAGKVGFSLGKYFSQNKVNVTGYYSRTEKSASEASKFTNSKMYKNLDNLIKDSDTIFITISDDSIYDIWQKISVLNIKGKILCHTSGSLSSKVFSNISNSGAFGYSIHPMFPFSDKYNSYKSLESASFTIEGKEERLDYLCSFLESLGNIVIKINSEKKALYHLSNVMVSNLALSLINLGCNYLQECGISHEEAINGLFPLIQHNINNIKSKGFIDSLTGPVERCDLGTIKHHIEAMPREDLKLYKALSLNLIELSKIKNPQTNYENLQKFLGGL